MRGKEVRRIRWKLDMTQAELAREVGLTPNSVARIERDERQVTPMLEKILRRLELESGLRS